MNRNYLFTSESVTEGHPDKMCDIISDAILDAYIEKDPLARVACEVTATTDIVNVMGEITSDAAVDIEGVVRRTVEEIGYANKMFGFDAHTCTVSINVDKQSQDISQGVNWPVESRSHASGCGNCGVCLDEMDYMKIIGAGDQGMMFGYACNETKSFMPAPIYYAHRICQMLGGIRKEHVLDYLGPDGKSMITFEYCDEIPVRVDTIVISNQHFENVPFSRMYDDIIERVIMPVIPKELMDGQTKMYINPTGRFVKGGPCADTGLTGRKIIVDTYGGMGRHGGGAFSGKDPTKVDRTGAYAARYVAKNIVAAKLADRCEVQIAYAIGMANPVSINVNTFGTSQMDNGKITQMVNDVFDLRPAALIERFDMRKPIYRELAVYGHMGRDDLQVNWEMTDKVNEITNYTGDYRTRPK